ncbi:MAG: transporter substrate-binding domain-containing protein [Nitrospinaceae bacterium]|nr:transporter substrate-binding domain-containing protein [Nitrospinaceae bacterium]MBT6345939.1 transporter substrate-binding domain-containing protein [Nitrospina sp.]
MSWAWEVVLRLILKNGRVSYESRFSVLKKYISKILLSVFIVLGLGCGQSSQESKIQRLVIAIDATFIPMSFLNDQGELDGFEVDLIKAVTKNAGFDYELVNIEWGGLFGGLITKKFDLVISSITILEERKNRMAFSIPYLQSGVAVLVRNDISNVESLEQLAEMQATIGAQINTTSYYFLQKYEGIKIKTYEKFGHAFIDLANEGNDGVVGDSVQVNYYFNKNKELSQKAKFLGSRLTSEFYGIVLRKEDVELKRKIDASLTMLIEDGTIQKLHDKWELGEFAAVPRPENSN